MKVNTVQEADTNIHHMISTGTVGFTRMGEIETDVSGVK